MLLLGKHASVNCSAPQLEIEVVPAEHIMMSVLEVNQAASSRMPRSFVREENEREWEARQVETGAASGVLSHAPAQPVALRNQKVIRNSTLARCTQLRARQGTTFELSPP